MTQPLYNPPLTPRAYAVSHRIRNADVWAAARQLYAAGATGPEVMERYGIERSAFYERARREGWRRRDQLEDQPLHDEYDLTPDQVNRSAADLAADAWGNVCRSIDRGRLAEARGWTAIFRELRALAVLQAEKGVLVVASSGDGRPSIVALGEPDSPDSWMRSAEGEADLPDLMDSAPESGGEPLSAPAPPSPHRS